MSKTRSETRTFPVYTNEEFVLETKSNPLYILADRFKCFRLRVRKNHLENEKVFAYLIAGDTKNERVLVYLTNGHPDHLFETLITRVRIHRRVDFDQQLGIFLGFTLALKLKDEKVFTFTNNAIPVFPKKYFL